MKNLHVYCSKYEINKKNIHALVRSLAKEMNFNISNLDINFISGDEIYEINKKYLKHFYTTDIITFNYSANSKILDGEIFISIDDALSNANKYKVTFSEEFLRLVIHGILHLLGFDDQINSDKKIMKRLENELLYKNKFVLL